MLKNHINKIKKIKLISFYLFFALQFPYAQNWEWSKLIKVPFRNYSYYKSSKLITDKNGIIYYYGSTYDLTDSTGSFLQSYSSNGDLLSSKYLSNPFRLHKLEYDGNSNFYFAATFTGNLTIDSISISSSGKTDGIIGKMDLQGKIIWMKTFGGPGADAAWDVCLNPADNSIYVSGTIKDTLFFDNVFQSVNAQSAIICQYSKSGELVRHKLFDYPSQKNYYTNSCTELRADSSGNFFALMDRKAERWWSNDPGTGPLVGRYLMKLNSSLDTIWTTYVNGPQSYYGWNCNNLRVPVNGDAYLINWNSGKYGGTGQIMRFDGNTGKIKWSYPNIDGTYFDLFIDSDNTIYVIGNEGANGCPCEYSNGGYIVIKKIDVNNSVMGETRVNVGLFNIIKDKSNNIFVTGAFGAKSISIGPDTLKGDSISDGSYFYFSGKFLSRLSNINCTPPEINSATHHPFREFFCPWDSVSLDAGPGYLTYQWSNGFPGQKIKVNLPGTYTVKVTEASGCTDYSLPITIVAKRNETAPKICLATFDIDSNKYKFYSALNFDIGTKSINIYNKQNSGGDTVQINQIAYTNYHLNQFVDKQSSPDSDPGTYFLSMTDSCGTESPLSSGHRPVFLTVETKGGNNILNWNAYEGFEYGKYFILRGLSLANMVVIDSVDKQLLTYIDLNENGSYYYQVKVIRNWGCYGALQVSSSNPARNVSLMSDCLSPLKDWTKIENQISQSKFRKNDKNKTSIYSGGEVQYPPGIRA